MPYTKKYEKTLYNRDWLYDRYVKRKMTADAIAKEIGCSPSAIPKRLKKFKIRIRTLSEVQKLAPHPGSHAPRPKKNKDTLHNELWLRKAYKNKNASDIAKELNCGVPSVISALRKFGIKTKNISEAKKGRPSIMKGVIDPDACSSTTLGRRAREACEEGPCLICGSIEKSAINHIDRKRKNNNPDNLERLCATHHRLQHHFEYVIASSLLFKNTKLTWLDIHRKVRKKLFTEYRVGKCCNICGTTQNSDGRSLAVNHKDRNHSNNSVENLELLCDVCHAKQHNEEYKLALKLCLKKTKYTILDVHRKARNRLLKQWKKTQESK